MDFIIVGHGMAGAVLAQYLLGENKRIQVFENLKTNSATRVAAGIYNPVAYRKLKMAEFADVFIPEAVDFYQKVEQQTNQHFFRPLPFMKLLTSIEEQNNWQIQSGVDQNATFMSAKISNENFNRQVKNPLGAGIVKNAGVLNTVLFIEACKKVLEESNSFSHQSFDYNQLQFSDHIQYKNIKAKHIVFCEGIGIKNNPWFNWLPIQQFKGELIEIYAPDLPLDVVINKGVFIIPLGEGIFKVGATHDWKNVNETPTEKGKSELLEKLDTIIQTSYKIINHKAGLRPASRDRRAYIGRHPKHPNLFVFNGLGSKGVVTAPWLARHFLQHIDTFDWHKTFNINRFNKLYTTHDS